MYTRLLDFNRRAIAWARANGKPLVGNTDLHVLDQMGTTYSLVGSEAEPDAICDAIRGGRVELRTSPLPEIRAAAFLSRMLWGGFLGRMRADSGVGHRLEHSRVAARSGLLDGGPAARVGNVRLGTQSAVSYSKRRYI